MLITAFIALVGGSAVHVLMPGEGAIDEKLYLAEIAPRVLFGPKKGSPPHYASDTGALAFNSFDVTPSIRGYNGPIKVLLGIDGRGTITGIRILQHVETRNYVHRLEAPEFLGQFLGKNFRDPFELDRDIDGISRATVTVQALAATVRESSRTVAGEVLGLAVGKIRVASTSAWKPVAYILLILLSVAGYLLTRRHRNLLRLRDFCLAGGIVVVGVLLSSPLSVLHILNMVLLRFSTNALWVIAVPGILLTLFLFGRLYCGWICPFGAIAEFVGRAPTAKWNLPHQADHRWRDMKYLVLWVVVIIVSVSGRPDLAAFETYVTLYSVHGTTLAWALLALMLAANLRIPRFWCRYLCPVGAIGGILSRTKPGYPSNTSCPMGNSPKPPGAECIRCNRCYSREREIFTTK